MKTEEQNTENQQLRQTPVSSSSKILHLTLNKKWFDMIASGEKKEEYRVIKAYWFNRLVFQPKKVLSFFGFLGLNDFASSEICKSKSHYMVGFNPFDFVIFKNGYSKNSKTLIIKCNGIKVSTGKTEWGAVSNEMYFTIILGDIVSSENC